MGAIGAMLTIGVDPSTAKPLKANEEHTRTGVKFPWSGFIVTPLRKPLIWGLDDRPGLEQVHS